MSDSHYRWTGYFLCAGPDADHPVCELLRKIH